MRPGIEMVSTRKRYGGVDNTKAVTLLLLGTTSIPSPAARPVYMTAPYSLVAGIAALKLWFHIWL
jgi:hypothetical protein